MKKGNHTPWVLKIHQVEPIQRDIIKNEYLQKRQKTQRIS